MSGAGAMPGPSLRDARAALLDAEDRVAAARKAVVALEAARQVADAKCPPAQWRLKQAAADVLRPSLDKLTAEIETMQRDLVRKRLVLIWAVNSRALADTKAANLILNRVSLPHTSGTYGGHDENGWPVAWEQGAHFAPEVIAALMRDADALIPELGSAA